MKNEDREREAESGEEADAANRMLLLQQFLRFDQLFSCVNSAIYFFNIDAEVP